MRAELVGFKEVQDALAHVPEAIRERAVAYIGEAGAGTETDYERGVPVDEGDLYRSIYRETRDNGLTSIVGARAPHARHVEFGTEDTPAFPALFPGFQRNVRILRKNLRGMLKDTGFKLRSRVRRANVTRRAA